MDRSLTMGVSIAALCLTLTATPVPAMGQESERTVTRKVGWNDPECDVSGYNHARRERFRNSCVARGINWVSAERTRRQLTVIVKYDYLFPGILKSNERQRIWLDTDRDQAPDYVLRATSKIGEVRKTNSWRSDGRRVSCDGGKWQYHRFQERLTFWLPQDCLKYRGKVRFATRSIDRYFNDLSYRQDYWPAKQSWGPHF